MSDQRDILLHSLRSSHGLLNRYVADLSAQDWLHRIVPGANCAAWIVGHLVLSERGMLATLGLTPAQMPALPEGFEKRFARDETAPKSADYGDTSALMALFNQHRELMIETVSKLPLDRFDKPREKPHPLFKTSGEFINFMSQHTVMHAGQITFIRRSLGRPPIA
jgi:uncharacterized damage-inducible protein DinB